MDVRTGVTVVIGGRSAHHAHDMPPMPFRRIDKMDVNLGEIFMSLKVDLVIHTAGT